MKTALLMAAGLFGLFAFLAGVQGQFVYCAVYTVPMLALLYIFFRLA